MNLLDYEALETKGIKFSDAHIWRLIRAGDFPKLVKIGNRNHWVEDEIDKYIAESSRSAMAWLHSTGSKPNPYPYRTGRTPNLLGEIVGKMKALARSSSERMRVIAARPRPGARIRWAVSRCFIVTYGEPILVRQFLALAFPRHRHFASWHY